jgi:aspartate racemase
MGMARVAVLGTRFTMAGPVYRRALPAVGIEPRFPNDEERADIDRIIFDELVEGVFSEPSRRRYVEIIERLKRDEGCDGVALVCTEIPLLVTADVSPLPILDSTRLLARAAFEVATGKRPFPTWRGGPLG